MGGGRDKGKGKGPGRLSNAPQIHKDFSHAPEQWSLKHLNRWLLQFKQSAAEH